MTVQQSFNEHAFDAIIAAFAASKGNDWQFNLYDFEDADAHLSWSRSFGQIFRFDKWIVGRMGQAAVRIGSGLVVAK